MNELPKDLVPGPEEFSNHESIASMGLRDDPWTCLPGALSYGHEALPAQPGTRHHLNTGNLNSGITGHGPILLPESSGLSSGRNSKNVMNLENFVSRQKDSPMSDRGITLPGVSQLLESGPKLNTFNLADADRRLKMGRNQYTCSTCSKQFTSVIKLKKHGSSHSKGIRCLKQGCNMRFASRRDMTRHWQSKHDPGSGHEYRCDRDGCKQKTFSRLDNLRSHMRNVHGTSEISDTTSREMELENEDATLTLALKPQGNKPGNKVLDVSDLLGDLFVDDSLENLRGIFRVIVKEGIKVFREKNPTFSGQQGHLPKACPQILCSSPLSQSVNSNVDPEVLSPVGSSSRIPDILSSDLPSPKVVSGFSSQAYPGKPSFPIGFPLVPGRQRHFDDSEIGVDTPGAPASESATSMQTTLSPPASLASQTSSAKAKAVKKKKVKLNQAERLYRCSVGCIDKFFPRKEEWRRHEETIHLKPFEWICNQKPPLQLSQNATDLCGIVFARADGFHNHLKSVHDVLDSSKAKSLSDVCRIARVRQEYKCSFCPWTSTLQRNSDEDDIAFVQRLLKQRSKHVSSHFDQDPVNCDYVMIDAIDHQQSVPNGGPRSLVRVAFDYIATKTTTQKSGPQDPVPSYIYYCCKCQDGPHNEIHVEQCVQCCHKKCDNCKRYLQDASVEL